MEIKNNLDLSTIDSKYKDILKKTEPYLLTYPGNVSKFNLSPFGMQISKTNVLSCINSNNAVFFDLLQNLDKLSFGPVGMPMEKWVFFDCGEMVGGIFGFAVRAKNLDSELLEKYGVTSSYEGLIPISMYISIPMAKEGSWFGHNLCSANSFLGKQNALPGLALMTKAIGVKTLNISEHYGATQWDSKALNIHLQLADMDVKSALTPAHSFIKTMTYKSVYTDELLLTALSGKKRLAASWDYLLDVTDENFLKKLQQDIEEDKKITVTGRPVYEKGKTYLPLKYGQ